MFPKLPSTTTTSVTVLLFAIICKTFFSRGKHFREITPQSLNLLVECTQFLVYLFYLDHFFSVANLKFNQSGNFQKMWWVVIKFTWIEREHDFTFHRLHEAWIPRMTLFPIFMILSEQVAIFCMIPCEIAEIMGIGHERNIPTYN